MNSSTSSSRPAEAGPQGAGPARRFLAWFAAAAFAVVLAFGVASELLLRRGVEPVDPFFDHLALLASSATPDAAFGDSHVARGFLGTDELVNLASLSETVEQIALKAEAYYADKAPGRVILQADPHLFSAYRVGAGERNYRALLAGGSLTPWGLHILDPYYRARLLRYWAVALIAERGLEPVTRFGEHGAVLSEGALSSPTSARERLDVAARIALHRPLLDAASAPERARYRSLVEGLLARGAEVCLAEFPLSPPYRAVADVDPAFAAGRAWFAALAAELEVPLVSLREAFDDPADFIDPDHLAADAAARLTPLLVDGCFGD